MKVNRNMCEGPMFLNIILHTIPIILSSILQLLFNAADLVVVGRFCGSISVAAVGATGSITNLIICMFIGISVGASVVVAQSIGANDPVATHKAVHTAIPIAVIGGTLLTVVGIIISKSLLIIMGTPHNVLNLSTLYMRIFFCGMIFNMIYNFGAAILRASGDTKRPLLFLTLAGILNVVLNVIFVTVFNMNVAGVALATVISQALSAFLVMLSLIRRDDVIGFSFKEMTLDKSSIKKMLVIGIPSGIQSSLFSVSNVIIQSSVNSFGDIFMSGNAAAANIEGFIFASMNSFHQSALNFSGQNYGAGKIDRVKKSLIICFSGAAVVGLVLGILSVVFGEQLLSIYITDSPLAINYGMQRMMIIALSYFICGLMDTTTGSIRGMGYSIVTMFITIIGACGLRVLWIYTIFQIPGFHTPQVLFLSYPISWTLTFIAEIIAFSIIYKKEKIKLANRVC